MFRFASVVSALIALAVPSVAAAERPPKVGEVHYFKQSGEPGPATNLEVFTRHTDAVRMKASYGGETAKAAGILHPHVDTHRYGPPWIPDPDNGRRALLNVMKASIAATGAVTLEVVAKNATSAVKIPVDIVMSDCHLEPPLYPFTCVVEP